MFERSRRLNSCILFVFLLNKRVWYIKIECMTEIKLYIGLRSSWLGDACLSPLTMGPWVTFLLQMNSSFLLVFVPIFVISQFYNSSLAAVFTTQNWNFGKQFGKKLKYEFSTNRDVSATLIGVDLDKDVCVTWTPDTGECTDVLWQVQSADFLKVTCIQGQINHFCGRTFRFQQFLK